MALLHWRGLFPAYMILYTKDDFPALVGRLYSTYYGTFITHRLNVSVYFCIGASTATNLAPVVCLFLDPFLLFYYFLTEAEWRREVLGTGRLDTVFMEFCICIVLIGLSPLLSVERPMCHVGWMEKDRAWGTSLAGFIIIHLVFLVSGEERGYAWKRGWGSWMGWIYPTLFNIYIFR